MVRQAVTAGERITYTLIMTNNGPSTAQSVDVKDALPVGVSLAGSTIQRSGAGVSACGGTVCQVGDMAVNEVVTVTLVGDVDPALADGTVLTNTATLFSDTPDPVSGNNVDDAATTVNALALLTLSKTALADRPDIGGFLTYRIVVTNAGPSAATNVVVTDSLDANTTHQSDTANCGVAGSSLTCGLGTILPNSTASFLVTVRVNSDVVSPTLLTNSAGVTTDTPLDPASDTTDTATATAVQNLGQPADLVVSKSAAASVIAGENLTYTIVVTNNGPAIATNTTVVDSLPDGAVFRSAVASNGGLCNAGVSCDLGDLAVGEVVTITVVVKIDADEVGSTLTNTVQANSDQPDPTPADATDTAATAVIGSVDLVLSKTASPSPAQPGRQLIYTIQVQNLGPSDAANVTVSDPLLAAFSLTSVTSSQGGCASLPCNLGTIPAGGSATVTLAGMVDSNASADLVNTATVTSTTPVINPGNDTATATTPGGFPGRPGLDQDRRGGPGAGGHVAHLHPDRGKPWPGCGPQRAGDRYPALRRQLCDGGQQRHLCGDQFAALAWWSVRPRPTPWRSTPRRASRWWSWSVRMCPRASAWSTGRWRGAARQIPTRTTTGRLRTRK